MLFLICNVIHSFGVNIGRTRVAVSPVGTLLAIGPRPWGLATLRTSYHGGSAGDGRSNEGVPRECEDESDCGPN